MIHNELPIVGLMQRYYPDRLPPAVVPGTTIASIPDHSPTTEMEQQTAEDNLFKQKDLNEELEPELEKIKELFGPEI